jgi:superkiller protein 3
MRLFLTRALLIAVGVSLHAGCAHRRAPTPADRFYLHKEARRATGKADGQQAPPSPALEQAFAEARRLMATARPEPKEPVATLETTDPALGAALKNLTDAPTAENLYDVGAAYHRRGLMDQAYSYYTRSLSLDSRHADTHEALARVWRDWGVSQLGLNNAHRAIYYAPTSASARSTLGTLLHGLGLRDEARRSYMTAVLLDRDAWYAFNNLCYLSFVEGKSDQAISECRAALRIDPGLAAAHNNLALIYAAMGRGDLARGEFAAAGVAANAAYNMGIVYLAQNRYGDAAGQFDSAGFAQPKVVDADRRARDSRRLADIARHAEGGE